MLISEKREMAATDPLCVFESISEEQMLEYLKRSGTYDTVAEIEREDKIKSDLEKYERRGIIHKRASVYSLSEDVPLNRKSMLAFSYYLHLKTSRASFFEDRETAADLGRHPVDYVMLTDKVIAVIYADSMLETKLKYIAQTTRYFDEVVIIKGKESGAVSGKNIPDIDAKIVVIDGLDVSVTFEKTK